MRWRKWRKTVAAIGTMSRSSEPGNIVLVGFMGAGKSTVGAELARRAGMRLVDLDHLIARRRGRTIREIFEQEGEEVFRDYETAALDALGELNGAVIATGGGVVGRAENWLRMRRLGTVVYLQAGWETLRERVLGDPERPLAAAEVERVHRLWASRVPLYAQADLVVDSEGGSPAEVAGRIFLALEQGEHHGG